MIDFYDFIYDDWWFLLVFWFSQNNHGETKWAWYTTETYEKVRLVIYVPTFGHVAMVLKQYQVRHLISEEITKNHGFWLAYYEGYIMGFSVNCSACSFFFPCIVFVGIMEARPSSS